MVSLQKVEGVNVGYKTVTTYCLCSDGIPLVAVSAFLLHVSLHQSLKTAKTYASRLKSFFSVIEGMGVDVFTYWKSISEREMSGYVYGVLKQSRGLQVSSIDNHAAAIGAFYNYAYKCGYILHKPLFSFSLGADSFTTSSLDAISIDLHDQYYSEDEFKKVILGNLQAKSVFILKRNELMMKLGYYAGFRSFEVTSNRNLSKEYMKSILPKGWQPKSEVVTVYGKGNKKRSVKFPIHLLEDIHSYLWSFDHMIGDCNILCKTDGRPFKSENPATEIFASAVNTYICKKDVTKQERELWQKRGFHKSRKCFATNFTGFCHENGLDPYIELPQAMGHEDLSTTFKYIYFEALQNNRVKVLSKLSLENSKLHKSRFGKSSKVHSENE